MLRETRSTLASRAALFLLDHRRIWGSLRFLGQGNRCIYSPVSPKQPERPVLGLATRWRCVPPRSQLSGRPGGKVLTSVSRGTSDSVPACLSVCPSVRLGEEGRTAACRILGPENGVYLVSFPVQTRLPWARFIAIAAFSLPSFHCDHFQTCRDAGRGPRGYPSPEPLAVSTSPCDPPHDLPLAHANAHALHGLPGCWQRNCSRQGAPSAPGASARVQGSAENPAWRLPVPRSRRLPWGPLELLRCRFSSRPCCPGDYPVSRIYSGLFADV